MTHMEVYRRFRELFPWLCGIYSEYFSCGKNCIRLRAIGYPPGSKDIVFTISSEKVWRLESVDSFLTRPSEKRQSAMDKSKGEEQKPNGKKETKKEKKK